MLPSFFSANCRASFYIIKIKNMIQEGKILV